MRFSEFGILTEARGLASRKIGDKFVSSSGDEMTFVGINFYPNSGGYKTPEELQQAINEAEELYGDIQWLNKPITNGGFGIVTFDLPDGSQKHYGRFFKVIKAMHDTMSWSNKDIPGYRLATNLGEKETSGLQPSEILTKFDNLTPNSIAKQVIDKFGKSHPLGIATIRIVNGEKPPISIPPVPDATFEAFRDYFCELLHPIALMRHTVDGNAYEAEELFFPDTGFDQCIIHFSTSKTEGLSDSILEDPNGRIVKVSSKGKSGGAAASVKNLLEAVHELKNPKLLKKYEEVINLLEIITKAGPKNAPIELALHFNKINQKEAGLISRMKELVDRGELTHEKVLKGNYLTKRLQKIYNERIPRDPSKVNPYYHMIAALAYLMADYINNNTSFSDAASEILNNAGLVTVDTIAKKTDKEWIIQKFDSKFPSDSITGVLISAQKGYASTFIKGNFTFKILKNNVNPNLFKDIQVKSTTSKKTAKKKGSVKASIGGITNKKGIATRQKRPDHP